MGFEWLPSKKFYKRHFICMACQKGFKRPQEEEMKHSKSVDLSKLMGVYYALKTKQDILVFIDTAYEKTKEICPSCQGEMQQVSYGFEVPPNRDNKAWKKLRSTMPTKTNLPYMTFIQWHRLELQKEDKSSDRYKDLQRNLAKLEKVQN